MAQKNTYKRETDSQTQTCGCQMKVGEGDGLRVWGSQMQPITFRMDKQGPTVYSMENWTQSPRINIMEKNIEKGVYVFTAASLCRTAEPSAAL